jgi:dTDP-4-amino-4,6-dideoxygalactose transaminase
VHQQPRYEGSDAKRGPLPETEFVASNVVTLPMYPDLTRDQLDRIVAALEDAIVEVW